LVVYQVVVDHFKQDTREFWTRANFFLVAHAGLFSAFVVAYPGMAGRYDLMSLSIPLLGLGTTVIWYIVLKGATLELRRGNPVPRIVETASGMINSIGLENPGVDAVFSSESRMNQLASGALMSATCRSGRRWCAAFSAGSAAQKRSRWS
jgi:hypothetical protein